MEQNFGVRQTPTDISGGLQMNGIDSYDGKTKALMSQPAVSAPTIDHGEFSLIRTFIEDNCGIVVGDQKSYLIESRLADLLKANDCTNLTQLYNLLLSGTVSGLRDKVIDAITTNETFWFRDGIPFELLRNVLLSTLLIQKPNGKYRIWSSGCSTGQEPYSMAMIIDSYLSSNPNTGLRLKDFEIVATDISSAALFAATAGRYDQYAMSRGIDDRAVAKYFKKSGRVWVINDEIRQAVTFRKFNLQDTFAALGRFDLIFCRNVLIYFSSELKSQLMDKFANSLSGAAILVLGSAETTSGYSERFDTISSDHGIYHTPRRR